MIDHVLDRYATSVDGNIIVINPADRLMVERHLRDRPATIQLIDQPAPTGMLDAILLCDDALRRMSPDRVWITWCDQVAISATTVTRLITLESASPGQEVIMPIARQQSPYIHFDRDADGRLTGVRQRREGDEMPAAGMSDAGLFSISRDAFERQLPEYAMAAAAGTATGERNFLPFLPWMATRGSVGTFEIDAHEAQGINTPDDVAAVERRMRQSSGMPS